MPSSSRRRIKPAYFVLAALAILALVVTAIALRPAEKVDTSAFQPSSPTIKAAAPVPLAVFVGDSYTTGSGTTNAGNRWSTLLSSSLNWAEKNVGKGGTGYFATSDEKGCGLPHCNNYSEMVPEVADLKPSIVVVSGGRNDYKIGTQKVTAAVTDVFQKMRAAMPNATIVSFNPFYDSRERPAGLIEMGNIVKSQTEAVGGVFVDIGQPLLNHPELIGPDGAHPTDAGYALLASASTDAIKGMNNPKLTAPEASASAAASSPAPQVKALLTSVFGSPASLTKADSGQQFGIWDNGKNSSGMAVDNGRLVHGDPQGANAASYLEAGIGKPVEMIGADVVFSDPMGQVALVAWQDSLVAARSKAVPDRIPNGGIHFVAGSSGWHLGAYDTANGGERKLAEGKLQLAADGKTSYKFSVIRKGDTAWIVLPGGETSAPIKDSRIAEWTGEWATWELFESVPGATPAAFTAVSAG